MKFLEQLRKWIDGEEDYDEQGQVVPRSKWDDFLVAVAREVGEVMQREMFTPPGGVRYVPPEYLVFLSAEDDAQWQGEKRRGLEAGLQHVLAERARQLAGDGAFQTRSFAIELKVDPALEAGRFRVEPVWDPVTEKTLIKPRKQRQPVEETLILGGDDEETVVRPRPPARPTFSVSVRLLTAGDAQPQVHPFYKDEVRIGRGAAGGAAMDLPLRGDPEVSRHHATLTWRGEGNFALTCEGKNPILLDGGRELAQGESATLRPGDRLTVGSFELTIV